MRYICCSGSAAVDGFKRFSDAHINNALNQNPDGAGMRVARRFLRLFECSSAYFARMHSFIAVHSIDSRSQRSRERIGRRKRGTEIGRRDTNTIILIIIIAANYHLKFIFATVPCRVHPSGWFLSSFSLFVRLVISSSKSNQARNQCAALMQKLNSNANQVR